MPTGREFEVSFRPAVDTVTPRSGVGNTAFNESGVGLGASRDSIGSAGETGAVVANRRRSFSWNVWNENASVNSDGANATPKSTGYTIHLRAEDHQVCMYLTCINYSIIRERCDCM